MYPSNPTSRAMLHICCAMFWFDLHNLTLNRCSQARKEIILAILGISYVLLWVFTNRKYHMKARIELIKACFLYFMINYILIGKGEDRKNKWHKKAQDIFSLKVLILYTCMLRLNQIVLFKKMQKSTLTERVVL